MCLSVALLIQINKLLSFETGSTHRFSPQLSPNKTWEGILGSFVLTMLFAAGFYALLPLEGYLSWALVLGVSPILFILAVIGDLLGSLVKRALEVKDSGRLLPGIGGIYDLLDSPALTVPFFALVLLLV